MIRETLFEAFVPDLLRTQLANGASGTAGCWGKTFPAAVLVADITGFSTLSERLARRGPRGAEDLRDLLNRFFGRLVTLVHEHDGEVLAFPGDAAVAVWPAGADGSMALRAATQCALAAQDAISRGEASASVHIQFRSGIGFGDVSASHVGGVDDRWHLVVTGDSLVQAVRAIRGANPGDVIVSPGAWSHIAALAAGAACTGGFRVRAVTGPRPSSGPAARRVGAIDDSALRRYVPRSVQRRIDAGQTEWLAEFRRLTVLFINLGAVESVTGDSLERLQRATVAVQSAVARYGGNIEHFLADDKGMVVVCGWGLALHAHADDAVRAVRAAVEARRRLGEEGLDGSFGLATGQVFTGLRGNQQRCDFAMIGSVVNLAAGLMQASQGGILCDAETFVAARQCGQFDLLPALAVKGHEEPVDAYRLIDLSEPGSSGIVGRTRERRVLDERLVALVENGVRSTVVIEGDAGIGKSRLLKHAVDLAMSRGVRVVVATGDAVERSAPYRVWRSLFEGMLGLSEQKAARDARVVGLVASNDRLVPFAPLLNPVLGLSLEENDRSRNVTPRGRAVLTRDLLVHLFSEAIGPRPAVVVLDDTQWFDSASWALAEGIRREMPHVLLLVATRPVPEGETPGELRRLKEQDDALVLHLDALSPEETNSLVCQRLRCRALDADVERLILSKAEGHPFFTEELAHVLRDSELVTVDQGVCRFAGARAADESYLLPNTVQVMVSSRIDQLPVGQQLSVKVASVLGRAFDLSLLRAIYPIDIDAGELARHVDALVAHDLVRRTPSSDAARGFEFKHIITQEVAYGLLPYAQRRQLHTAVAVWYEREHEAELARFYPLLADHWGRAEAPDRALLYRERAGNNALDRFANEEAVRFFTEALAIDAAIDPVPDGLPPIVLPRRVVSTGEARRIRWRRRLGEAFINLGMWTEGWAQLELALAALGLQLPTTRTAWAHSLARQLGRQLRHRAGPSPKILPAGDASELMVEAVRAYQRICSVSYVLDRKGTLFFGVLAALNLAERLPPTGELATLYASAANISALIPARRLAKAYGDRARRVARELNDPAIVSRVLGRASVYRIGLGEWAACDDLELSMSLADQVGDPFQWEESCAIRTRAAHMRGEFELSVRLGAEIRVRAVASGTAAHQIWGIDGEAWGYLYRGAHDKALERATTGLKSGGRGDRIPMLDLLGVTALVHLYRGNLDTAREAADRIRADLARSRPAHFAVLAMSAAAETYVTIAELTGATPDATLVADAASACRLIERYARINPPASARAFLWRGCVEWLAGRRPSAHKAWRRCLAEAERFALPYETARASYEIGRRLGPPDPERRQRLERAAAVFRDLGAEFELDRVARAQSAAAAVVM